MEVADGVEVRLQRRKVTWRGILMCLGGLVAVTALGMAYALTSGNLVVSGTVNIDEYEGLVITNVAKAAGSGGSVVTTMTSGTFAANTITLESSSSATTVANYTVYNNTDTTYYFTGVSYMTQAEIEALGISSFVAYDNANIVIDTSSYAGSIGVALAPGGSMTIPVGFKYAGSDIGNTVLNISLSLEFSETAPVIIEHTIHYNLNGGSGSIADTVFTGSSTTITSTVPTRTNYVFTGWQVTVNNAVETVDYAAGATYTISGDGSTAEEMTLYAKWIQYQIVYDANEDGSGGPGTIIYTTSTPTISTKEPSSDYDFEGWATKADASSAEYDPGDTYDGSWTYSNGVYSATLYAVYDTSSCVANGTLITLADGSRVAVENLDIDDEILVWDFEKNEYATTSIFFFHRIESAKYVQITLQFDNGEELKIANEHGVFDATLSKYVYINANNVARYVGDKFVFQESETTWGETKLLSYAVTREIDTINSPASYRELAFFANGILTRPAFGDAFDYFDIDTDYATQTLRINQEKKTADILKYGLYTYADFSSLVSEYVFEGAQAQYMKIAIGKGLTTWDNIMWMIDSFAGYVYEQHGE